MRRTLALIALGCFFCLLGNRVLAQNSQPKNEIFGGYAWLFPNGWGDLDYKINNIPNAFDASNTYYLPNARNVGLLIDGSGHFNGGTTPPNLENGSNNSTAVGYVLGGLQYKYHSDKVSPFVRGFVGGASLSPDCCGGTQWSFAAGGGGGLDRNVKPRFSIRLAQVDYIYSNYDHRFQTTHPTQWNSVRLAAGVVFNLGNYWTAPVSCTASAAPGEVMAGEPVKLTATGINYNSNHTLTYAWTTNGGRLSNAATQSTEIDTTGLAPGSYAANATITDPKLKKMNSSTCAAAFVVKQPPPPVPPVVSCTVTPATIAVGDSATVTMTASSADRRPLTYNWSTTGGQLSSNDTTATVTASNADAGHTITVTGTATDDRSLSASCTVQVSVPAIKTCVNIEDWGSCTFEKNPKKPWRVDNDCKDTLDKLALRLQQMPNGKLVIVGYTDEKETVDVQQLGAQRSVNVKYYLTTDGPTKSDASRIEPREGGTKGKATHFYLLPEGSLCSGQVVEGTPVDESTVQGRSRSAAGHGKKAKKVPAPSAP